LLLVVCRLLPVCWLLAVALSILLGVRLLLAVSRLDVLLIHLRRDVAGGLGHGKAHRLRPKLASGWVLRGWSCLNAAQPSRDSPSTVCLLSLLRLLHHVRALRRARRVCGRGS